MGWSLPEFQASSCHVVTVFPILWHEGRMLHSEAATEREGANSQLRHMAKLLVLILSSQTHPLHLSNQHLDSLLPLPTLHSIISDHHQRFRYTSHFHLLRIHLFVLPPSHPSPKMMLPVSIQRRTLGTGHLSAGPRLSTTQQGLSMPTPINHDHCLQRFPPAGSHDDCHGDAPPPYFSLSPLGSIVTGATNTEVTRGTTHTERRAKSESCASPFHSHDDDFLANLAAIQLLSGCTASAGRQSSDRCSCCGIGCDGLACAVEAFNLRLLSKELSKHTTRPVRIQTTLHGGADGHMSLESTDRIRMGPYCRSTPMTPSVSRELSPSENLDRRLRSIEDALHGDSFSAGTSKKRLHTSEVSRKEQSLTADGAVDVGNPRRDDSNVLEVSVKSTSRGILGALRNLQQKDRPRRSVFTFPSLDSTEMPSPCDPEVGRRT